MFRKKPKPEKECADILRKIETSLDEARKDKSFPKVNEGRRLAKELESIVAKLEKKEDKSLWSSQLVVVNDEIESVMASLMEEPSNGAAPASVSAGASLGGGGGLFDGLQLGGTSSIGVEKGQLEPAGAPSPSPAPAPAADMLSGGLFAGLTLASEPTTEQKQNVSKPSPSPIDLDSLISQSESTGIAEEQKPEALKAAASSVHEAEKPVASEVPEPAASQTPTSGSRRRKKNLRVGYARKEKTTTETSSASAASKIVSPKEKEAAGSRLPLSAEEFVTTESPTSTENASLPGESPAESTEEGFAAAVESTSPSQEDHTVMDEVGEPMKLADDVEEKEEQVSGLIAEEEEAEDASAEEDSQDAADEKPDLGGAPLLSLDNMAGDVDEPAVPSGLDDCAEEEESLDFDFDYEGSDAAYADCASKLEKILDANFRKLDFQNSQILALESETKSKRFSAANEIVEAKKQIDKLEEEQTKAVEVEEFEKADELNSSIEEAKEVYDQTIQQWYKAQEQCEDIAGQLASILESKNEVKLKYAEALKKLGEALESKASGIDEGIAELEKENAEHEANMSEILEDDVSRLNALKRVLQEREEEVKQKITEKTTQFVEEKSKHEEVKSKLEEELEEIKETLRKKEEELAGVQGDIDVLDEKIGKVEAKFAKQQDKLNAERMDIEEDEKKFEDLQAQLKSEQEGIKEKINEKLAQKEQLRIDSEAASKASMDTESQMKEDIENAKKRDSLRATLRDLREEENAAAKKTDGLKVEVDEKKSELTLCKDELDRMLLAVEESKCVIKNAEEKIPKLEEEKKAAVAKKNFKDAAKFSSEAKALIDDKNQAETSIIDLEKSVELGKKKRSEFEEIVEKLEGELSVADSEARKLQSKHLAITITMLNETMEVAAAEENFEEAAALQNEIDLAKELSSSIEASLETAD